MPYRTDKKHSENVIAEVTQEQIKFILVCVLFHEVIAHYGIEKTDGYTCSQQLLKEVSNRHTHTKNLLPHVHCSEIHLSAKSQGGNEPLLIGKVWRFH